MRCVPSTQEPLRRKRKIVKVPGFEEGDLKRIWKCKEVTIVSVIFGTLGMVSISRLRKQLEVLDIAKEVQKVCLLGTARILRRLLDKGY